MELLSPEEVRVIGCLLEKESTTPDQYPLSLNALTSACNQKSARDPVMNMSQTEVQAILDGISDVVAVIAADYRVRSINNRFYEQFPGRDPAGTRIMLSWLSDSSRIGRGRSSPRVAHAAAPA